MKIKMSIVGTEEANMPTTKATHLKKFGLSMEFEFEARYIIVALRKDAINITNTPMFGMGSLAPNISGDHIVNREIRKAMAKIEIPLIRQNHRDLEVLRY